MLPLFNWRLELDLKRKKVEGWWWIVVNIQGKFLTQQSFLDGRIKLYILILNEIHEIYFLSSISNSVKVRSLQDSYIIGKVCLFHTD